MPVPFPPLRLASRLAAALVLLALLVACRDWPEESVALEQQMAERINELRDSTVACPSGPVSRAPELTWDESLAWAARLHAQDMAQNDYFDHRSQDGREFTDRITAEGYGGTPRSENLAAGTSDVDGTLSQWVGSDGHCLNLTDSEATCVGVGYAFDEDSEWRHYWVFVAGIR